MDQEERYERHLSELSDSPNMLRPLLRLEHDGEPDWEELVLRLEARADREEEPVVEARFRLEAARLALVHLEDRDWSEQLLSQAADAGEGTRLEPEIRLFELAMREGQQELLAYFTQALEEADSNRMRARLYLRMGLILERLFDELGEAANSYRYARELQADYLPALWAQKRIARKRNDWQQLGDLLSEEIEWVDDPGRQSKLAADLGHLYLDRLGEEELASECLEIAYELDGTNERARAGLVELGRLDEPDEATPPDEPPATPSHGDAPVETPEQEGAPPETPDEPEAIGLEDTGVTVEGEPPEAPPMEDEAPDAATDPLDDEEAVELDELSDAEADEETTETDASESRETAEVETIDEEDSPEEDTVEVEAEAAGSPPAETPDAPAETPPPEPIDEETAPSPDTDDAPEEDTVEVEAEAAGSPPAETPSPEPSDESETTSPSDAPSTDDDIETLEADEAADGGEEVVDLTEVSEPEADEATFDTDEAADTLEVDSQPVDADESTPPEATDEIEADEAIEVEADAGEAHADEESEVDAELEETSDPETTDTSEDVETADEGEAPDEVDTTDEAETTGDATEEASELEESTWEERVETYLERARSASSDQDALDWLVESARLAWLHDGFDDESPHWDDAIALGLVDSFYEQTHFYIDDPETWATIADRLESEDVDEVLLGHVAYIDRRDPELGAEYAESTGDDELAQLEEDLEEAASGWRRFKRTLRKRYDDLEGDRASEAIYGYLADLARGAGLEDKEADAMRRMDREVDDDRARDRLLVAYRNAGKWQMYGDLLEEQAESLDESRRADTIDWLEEAVRIYRDEVERDSRVMQAYEAILEVDPEYREAVDRLVEIYDEMGRSRDLIEALQRKAELAEDDGEQIELYTRIANLFLDTFRNEGEAIDAYESILEIEPHHEEALEFLQEMYEKRRKWKRLVSIRRRQVETIDDEDERIARLKEVAELASDRLREPDRATELWLDVLERAPEDRDALDALETLYEKSRDYEALADIVEQKAELVEADEEREDLFHTLGRIYSDRLEQPEDAIDAWRRALEIEPDDRKARNALENLYVEHRKWEDLEAFYAERDAHRELVRKFQTLTGKVEDESVEIDILLRGARIWRDELDETDRAQRNLEEALELDPHHEEAARQLEPIYREAEAHDDLREVLEIVLDHQDEAEKRHHYQLELARLHDGPLEAPGLALDWYARALREQPDQLEVADDLESAAERSERWEDVVDVYSDVLERDSLDDDVVRDLRMRLGRTLFEQLDRPDEALIQFETVLETDDEDVEALAAMEAIYEHEGRWNDLMEIYERRLELVDDDSDRVEILHGMASLAEEQKGDVDEALEQLDRALELEPSNVETLESLHRLYRQEGRHAELADVIEREIDLIDQQAEARAETNEPETLVDPSSLFAEEALADRPDLAVDTDAAVPSDRRYEASELEQLVDLYTEYGLLQQEELDHDDEAVEALGRVLNWRPSHATAREGLEVYLDDDDRAATVARRLEPIYELHEEWHPLVDTLELQVDVADTDDDAIELLERIATIHLDSIGAPVESFETWARIVRRRPEHDEACSQLRRIAAHEELWDDLAQLDEEVVADLEPGSDLHVDYLFDLGDLYADRLDDPFRAVDYYRDILDERPESRASLDRLEDVYHRTEQWRELLEIYEQQLEFADDEEAREIRFRIALVWEQQLDQPRDAIETLHDVLEDDGEDLRAVRALNRILEDHERWDELADSVERELEWVDDDAAPTVKKRLGDIYCQRLAQPVRAVDLYEEVLEDDPSDTEAREALEELMYREDAPSGRISEILEPLYLEDERWASLIEALDIQVDHGESPDVRLELLHRIARLYDEELDEPRAAFETQARALREDAEDESTLDALYRLAEELEDRPALIEVFETEADRREDPDHVRSLLRRAAAIYIEELEQLRDGAMLLHDVLELFPGDLETIAELEAIYRELEDWEELVDILQHRADHTEATDERKDLLYQAGNIYDDVLERPREAVDVYRTVLQVDGEDHQALEQLQDLYTRLEEWEELLDVHQTKLELVESDEARKDLLYAIGPLYEDQLDRPYEAIGTYRDLLDIDETALEALERLADLYEETTQWHELLESLERQRELVSIPEEKHHLSYEIGEIWENRLGDVFQAVEVYSDILDENPDHAPTREALESLIDRGEAEVEAAEVLQPIYEAAGEWEHLVSVKERLIETSPEPERQIELYRAIGEIYEEELARDVDAFQAYLDAIEVDPSRADLLDTAERLAGQLDQWDVLVDWLDVQLDDETDFEVVTDLNSRIGRMLEEELADPRGAIDRYERALEADPDDVEVNAALDTLYQQEGEWANLADVLKTRIRLVDDAGQLQDFRSRLALLYKEELDRPDEAIDTIERILENEPEHQLSIELLEEMFTAGRRPDRILGILEPYYRERDRYEALVHLYERREERLDDPLDQFELLEEIGALYLNELDDPDNALSAYGDALSKRPDARSIVERVDELAEETGAWEETAGYYYEALEEGTLDDETSVQLWLRLARILDTELGQMRDAEMAYQQVRQLDPGQPEALEALDRIYHDEQRWDELAEILLQRLDHTYDEELIVELEFRLGQIYQYELEDARPAIDTYRDLLDIRPHHREALVELETLHRRAGDWEELFSVLERQAEATSDVDEEIEIYAQMARIAEDEEMLGRPLEAIERWRDVLNLRPDHVEAIEELGRLYYEQEQWEDLVDILERELDLTDAPDERIEIHSSLGTVWSERLEAIGPAIDAWESVLELDDTDLEALRALRELYKREADYAELEGILDRLIEHGEVPDDETADLWIELAEVRTEHLFDPEAAIEAWREVLSNDPEHAEALEQLEELYLQEGQWEEAAHILEMQVDHVEDDVERVDILYQIAELWDQRLGDPEQAAVFYEQIREIDPEDLDANRELETIYLQQDDQEAYLDLVDVYLDRAEIYGDEPEQRLETLRSAAGIFRDELDTPEKAFVVLKSAFNAETADNEQLHSELEDLAGETDQWEALVEAFEGVVRDLGDVPLAADLHERVGNWCADELDRPDDAIYHMRMALDVDPDRVEIFERLEGLYREIEAWPELADVLEERIELSADPDVEIDLWRNLGELYELQLEDLESAIDAYWNILDIDDADLLAIESLERIYESEERWRDLIDILERKAETSYGEEEIEIRRRIATVWEEQVGNVDHALDAYRELLEVERDEESSYAFDALERLYREHEDWNALVDLYDEQLSVTHDPDEEILLHGKKATIQEDHFDDPDAAVQEYEDVQMLDPNNTTALENLERLYRDLGEWFDEVDTLQQHIEIVEDPDREVDLQNELARVQWNQLDEPYAAIEAYEASLELDPDQPSVLVDLADLHLETNNWQEAIEVYEDLAERLDDPDDVVEIYHTIAGIFEEELRNTDAAETYYRQALDVDPGFQPARDALEILYEEREKWESLVDLYAEAAGETLDLTEKAQYLAQIGEIYELELDARDRAFDYYEQALEEDPRLLEAAEPLIDLYLEDDLWEKAVPLLEMVVERYENSDEIGSEQLEDRYVQLGTVYDDLEQQEAALEQYWNAYELDRDDVDVLIGLSRLLFETEDYEAAADIFEELEMNHLETLDDDERLELFYKSGETWEEFDDVVTAIDYYEQALELDGYHRDTLEALVELHADEGHWERVVDYNRRLREVDDDPSFQFTRLTRIGEVCADELGDMTRAVEAYREALDIRPNSVAVLRKLLQIYRNTGQWHEALDMLDRLIEQQDDPSRRAHFNYVAAVICRDELQNPERAIEYFEAALDADVTEKLGDAFPEVERIYRKMAISTDREQEKRRIWKELERAYRRMLHRIADSGVDLENQIKFKLWKGLGEIYHSHLNFEKNWRESAIKAFRTASQLRPDNERVRLLLADLESQRSNVEAVVEQHRALLEHEPFRIESYKALFDAYMDAKQYDRAWCIASALVFLEQASPREREMYEKHRAPNLRRTEGTLDRSAYDKLYYPEQDQRITEIMRILNQGLREYYAEDIGKWGINPREDELALDQGSMFADIYGYLVQTLNVAPEPEVYLKRDQALGVQNANTHPPAILAGADIVRNQDPGELAFRLGALLGSMRPEHYLASIEWPTEGLKMLFMAAMYITNPTEALEQQLGENGLEWAGLIQEMPSQRQMKLQKHVSEFLESGENPDLSAWRRHVEHTTNRLGLLMCGDINQAATCIRNGQVPIAKGEVRDQIHELLLFAIGDEFIQLRKRLGIAIDS